MDMDPETVESDSSIECTAPSIIQTGRSTSLHLLPEKCQERYKMAYKQFMDWRKEKELLTYSENVLLEYFEKLSEKFRPSSLWAHYSMLRSSLITFHNVNISEYIKLRAFLKTKAHGYRSKKSKTLTAEHIHKFLQEAPDEKYLFTKVVLIVGISGACRKHELAQLKVTDIEDLKSAALIYIRDRETKQERSFTISGKSYEYFKKYAALRPTDSTEQRFFLNYQKQRCTRQPVGINKLGFVPKEIASYLRLENPELYTGHCFRRTSATILEDSGGDVITTVERYKEYKSYIDKSLSNKMELVNSGFHSVKDSFSNGVSVDSPAQLMEEACDNKPTPVMISKLKYMSSNFANGTEPVECNDIFVKDEPDISEEDPLEGTIVEIKTETDTDSSHNVNSSEPSPKRAFESSSVSASLTKKTKRQSENVPRSKNNETSFSPTYEDECSAFTKYVCSKLRQYTPEVRSRVQHEISTILLEADLGQFQSSRNNCHRISSNRDYNPPSQQNHSLPSPEINCEESSDALSTETEQKYDFD